FMTDAFLVALLQADPNFWQRVTPFDTLADRVLALLRGQESPVAPPGDTTTAFLLPDRSTDIASARVLDANFNRCREALRVLEDYCRFVLDDRFLTGQVK